MPPLVTISSARSGRRPCSCSWRSIRYSRTLGIPSHGVYCSATAASSRSSRAAISSSSSVGNVAGLGKPPVIDSTPGGLPARIVVSSSPPRSRVRRANACAKSGIDAKASALGSPRSSAATCSSWFVSSCSASPRRLRREDRPLAAADQLGGLQRGRDPLGPRRSPGRRRRRTRCRRAPRRRRRRRSSRRTRRARPSCPSAASCRARTPAARAAQAAHVAAVAVGDDAASPRRCASVANSSPNTARAPPFVAITSTSPGAASASALITGRWSSSATTVNAGPAIRTSGTIARTAGSTTGSVLSASQSAETSMASSRSIRSTRRACHTVSAWRGTAPQAATSAARSLWTPQMRPQTCCRCRRTCCAPSSAASASAPG